MNLKDLLKEIQSERKKLRYRQSKIRQVLEVLEDRIQNELSNQTKDFRQLTNKKLSYTIVELIKAYVQASTLDANISKDLISSFEKEFEMYLKQKKVEKETEENHIDYNLIKELESKILEKIQPQIKVAGGTSSDE